MGKASRKKGQPTKRALNAEARGKAAIETKAMKFARTMLEHKRLLDIRREDSGK